MLDDPDAPAKALMAMLPGAAEQGLAEEMPPEAGPDEMAGPLPGENLAERLDAAGRASLVTIIAQEVEQAEAGRKDFLEIQRKGLERLGVDRTLEARSDPFEGASAVTHPSLMQAVLDFQGMAVKEWSPSTGPCRETPDSDGPMGERQARAGKAINAVYTRHMSESRSEDDRLLMLLPLEGSSFKKTWWDPTLGRPRQAYVSCDQVIMPYSDSGDPATVPFIAHRLFLHQSQVDAYVGSGFWLEHSPMFDTIPARTEVRDQADKTVGVKPDQQQSAIASQFTYLEVQVYTAVPTLFGGKPREYVVTYEQVSQTLVALRLNEDEKGRRKASWTHYRMFPWKGAYGLGLLHVIGGLTDAATGALRALLDSAHLSNTMSGVALGGAGIKNTAIELNPFEFARVDAPPNVTDIREVIMPMPFAGPSTVLYELLGFLGSEAKEFASISMQRLAEGSPNMPVGTTLALVEQGAKIYSAIHERLFDARKGELRIIQGYAGLMAEELLELVPDLEPGDLSDDVPVLPVSSPQAPSQVHRIAKAQAGLDLAAKGASVGVQPDMRYAVMETAAAMGLPNAERYFPEPPEPVHADPFTETVAALKGSQLAMDPGDPHELHVQAHAIVAILPGVGQSPGGQALILHALEHAAAAALAATNQAVQVQGQALMAGAEVDAMQPASAGMELWSRLVAMIAPALQPPDPTQGLIEVERAKVEAKKEEVAVKATTEIALDREKMRNDLEVLEAETEAKKEIVAAQLVAKVQTAREGNASQERIAAARVQGQRATSADRAAQLRALNADKEAKKPPTRR